MTAILGNIADVSDVTIKSESEQAKSKNCKVSAKVKMASYQEYKALVRLGIKRRMGHEGTRQWLKDNMSKVLAVFLVDFTPVHSVLLSWYSPRGAGCNPWDPQMLMRSLMLMSEFGFVSIKKWVKHLRSAPLLAVLAGGDPEQMPAASTYYDFLRRLENGAYQPKCVHRVLPSDIRHSSRRQSRKATLKPGDAPEHDVHDKLGVVRSFARELIAKEQESTAHDLDKRLNDLLLELGVRPSVAKGCITGTKVHAHNTNTSSIPVAQQAITLAGDGSVIESLSNSYGKSLCQCRKQGIYDCNCARLYSDPQAFWGWNNRDKTFTFGYRFFQLVCADGQHNLPTYLTLDSANKHEALMLLSSLDRQRKAWQQSLPECVMGEVTVDALFDMYACYEYLAHYHYGYAIPYRTEPAKCLSLGDTDLQCSKDGVPLCKAGLPMLLHGKDRQGRHVYHCPVKRSTHKDGKTIIVARVQECPLKVLCEPHSKLGPITHVSPSIDLRIHPSIARESQRFQQLRNLRSCCERSNSMKKFFYKAEKLYTRVLPYAFIRLTFISILEHARVWVKQKLANVDLATCDLLSLFT